jgi:flagellar biosynthesis/type III secretory pathway chaperone
MPMNTTDTDRLSELIAAKLQVAQLLVGLARRQLELAERGEMSPLLKLLAAKQTVLDQLQRLERQLDPYREQDPERRVWRSAADRQRCQEQMEQCGRVLHEAVALEKQGETAMVRRRQAAAEALAQVQSASDARTAYAAPESLPAPSVLHCEG